MMARKTKPTDGMQANNSLAITQRADETGAQALARKLLEPDARNAHTASVYAGKLLGKSVEQPGFMDFVDHMQMVTGKAEAGDLAIASRLLAAQAITLDTMFAELARRAALNMSDHINAAERYGRLALKAQSNCRATLETLAKLHQPREQTVRHVHVNDGGQAVIADQFHHHTGDRGNRKNEGQSHATEAAGGGTALPSPDPIGNGMPISSREGEAAMQDARRDESRRS